MNSAVTSAPLGAAELQKLLTDVDPGVLLAPPRLLRRVIKEDRLLGGVGLHVPHRKTYTIRSAALLQIADRDELGITEDRTLPDHLILLACPEDFLAKHSREQALVRFWRLLFHARIDQALEQQLAAGSLTEARLRQLVQRIGLAEFEEAQRVLRHEDFLLPPADIHVAFVEFAALFLELRYFARPLLKYYFPAVEDPARMEEILKELIDGSTLFAVTRPAGAADPVTSSVDDDTPPSDADERLPPPCGLPSPAKCQKLLAAAEKAGQRGNVARSALLRMKAADLAPPELLDTARREALKDIERLVARLQAALELHDREADEWAASLPAVLGPASRGIWPHAARLLYDLQKVCVDHERDLYAIDMVEWFNSLGRKKIKRQVPLQADVLLVKHLRSAAGRLSKVRIGDEDRRRLGILLRAAIHHCEDRLREKIRPILTATLEDVGFKPANPPEEIALATIVEELLDRVTRNGFINMGDLRDAVSRNQLKLPDASFKDLILGDWLLKANRQLALKLDGVYHRGEIYLRELQRASSLLFGTVVGRWVTLFLLLPFGGAFATLIFFQEMAHIGGVSFHVKGQSKENPVVAEPTEAGEQNGDEEEEEDEAFQVLLAFMEEEMGAEALHRNIVLLDEPRQRDSPNSEEETHGIVVELSPRVALAIVLGLGFFIMGVLHWPAFRHGAWIVTKRFWRCLRGLLYDWPVALIRHPSVRRFFNTPAMLFVRRRLLPPLVLGLTGVLLMVLRGKPGPMDDLLVFGGLFVVAFLFLSSRWGRHVEEAVTDWIARNWYWLREDALPGFINLILQAFKDIMDRLERILYTVDEWFRFRPGDSSVALLYKPLLGLIWFFMTYFIRVVINLFIEPTVNPIKHFPAVTVGAKLIVPFYFDWTNSWTALFAPMAGEAMGRIIANAIFILLPGICGFAVWEFKENWKLYRANRPRRLKRVMIGSHGEAMIHFMRPGFHSGTLPKLYTKLRTAHRRGDGRKIHKHHETLHHVAESLGHFIERELILVLERSKSWGGLKLHVGQVMLASTRVRIELVCPELSAPGAHAGNLWLSFEVHTGWLTASLQQSGWLHRLNDTQMAAFTTALAGLYKLAGVHVIRQQLEAQLPPGTPYFIAEHSIVLYPYGNFARPEARSFSPVFGQYDSSSILWDEWVAAWSNDRAGITPEVPLTREMQLLPFDAKRSPLPVIV